MDRGKKISNYLFAVQGIGAALFAVVAAAYIFGLRATTSNVVLHSEPAFRIALSAFGGLFLLATGAAVALAYATKRDKKTTPI